MIDNIQAVCFDAGGTLIFPDYNFVQKLLSQYGVKTSIGKLQKTEHEAKSLANSARNPRPWKIYFSAWFLSMGVKENDLTNIFNELWQRHRQKNLWSILEEDAIETLTELKNQNFPLGVISNSDGSLEKLFEELELTKYFDIMVDSEVIGVRKPEKAIFHDAVNKLGVQPEAVLYIGDSYEIDIIGAQNAGLKSILYDPHDSHQHINCLKIARLKQLFDFI